MAEMILATLLIFALFLIPLAIQYFLNPPKIHPILSIPAESVFLTSAFFLLKPPVASSLIFESLPHALQIVSIVAFLLAGDVLFKALLYIGVDPQSETEVAPTIVKVLIIHGRIFCGHLKELVYHVLGFRHLLFESAVGFGRTLCGLDNELDDLELLIHIKKPPSCTVS
ncbi:uncharacterized protein LACBIDRAFT_307868 [Laccaria bicolor S238N-H82]|uniref:Predicted protein n=1 Tax=Laccaria bicolor (strain S238N-H82 / ATCC MYA-4686) TaxID=486041 RepID=B0DQW4_LACBS|nr:uncharacterized protein LACBIDRAFT_307868 [Laccaria bicolor S238N-H82]EDR02957.1 predicted protein [Laccaria bicolor S238N-H82]|eukprot:XP_001886380.1 predicted protein [Laccaria bicolor S238N-H82]